jgi:polysaccharide pyruvyl transferase CsaB
VRLLISGYYGFGNLGDEALLEVIVERVRGRLPNSRLEVLSATPQATTAKYGIEGVPRWDWREVRSAIGRADAVLSGGGGLLQNSTSLRSLIYYAGILREAIRARKKTMVFAQSIGPLDFWGRLIVRQFCRGLDRATVRDERSQALLTELLPETPIDRSADPVFLYEKPTGVDLSEEGLGSGNYAVISVRKSAGFRDAAGVITRVVDRLEKQHDIRSAFLPLGGAPDAALSADMIRGCASNPVMLPECTLPKAAAILGGARLVVGMRLHSLIFAARYNVPFLALAYDPKVAALCEDLQYPLPPLMRAGAQRPSDETIDGIVDRAVADSEAIAKHLGQRANALRVAAQRNFDVLSELLSD